MLCLMSITQASAARTARVTQVQVVCMPVFNAKLNRVALLVRKQLQNALQRCRVGRLIGGRLLVHCTGQQLVLELRGQVTGCRGSEGSEASRLCLRGQGGCKGL